jgi:hypothetical protein
MTSGIGGFPTSERALRSASATSAKQAMKPPIQSTGSVKSAISSRLWGARNLMIIAQLGTWPRATSIKPTGRDVLAMKPPERRVFEGSFTDCMNLNAVTE